MTLSEWLDRMSERVGSTAGANYAGLDRLIALARLAGELREAPSMWVGADGQERCSFCDAYFDQEPCREHCPAAKHDRIAKEVEDE